MLKGINPILRGEVLKPLDEMGHGEWFALVDSNYPAYAPGVPVVDLGNISAATAAEAVFSVFPLDEFASSPLERMAIDDDPTGSHHCHDEVRDIANRSAGQDWAWTIIPRLTFYNEISKASLIIRCLEDTPFSCFLFRKGVV